MSGECAADGSTPFLQTQFPDSYHVKRTGLCFIYFLLLLNSHLKTKKSIFFFWVSIKIIK
jgi:hypothetical protein